MEFDFENIKLPSEPVDVEKFVGFVQRQHAGTFRKDGAHYFGHCENVAALSRQIATACGEDEICKSIVEAASYGHDLFEDTKTDFEDVMELAGREVATLISCVSDDKRLPSDTRHKLYVQRLAAAPRRAQMVKLGDLWDNTIDSFDLCERQAGRRAFVRRWHARAVESLMVLHKVETTGYHKSVREMLDRLKVKLDDLGVPPSTQGSTQGSTRG